MQQTAVTECGVSLFYLDYIQKNMLKSQYFESYYKFILLF